MTAACTQVDGSSMALLSNNPDDDMRLIAELTISRLQMMCTAVPPPHITSHQSKSVFYTAVVASISTLAKSSAVYSFHYRSTRIGLRSVTKLRDDSLSISTYNAVQNVVIDTVVWQKSDFHFVHVIQKF